MRPPSSLSATEEQSVQIFVSKIAMQLRKKGKTFFHKVISKSMVMEVIPGPFAYALEFPLSFVQEHEELFKSAHVTFERKNHDKRWPIEITVRKFKYNRDRVFAYGEGGWKDFFLDNKIQVGDVAFFIWLGMSRYQVVHIASLRPLKDDHDASPAERPEPSALPSNCWSPNKCRTCWLQIAPAHRPRFVVTVSPSQGPLHVENEEQESLSLEVPGSFWERHRRYLEEDELCLQGPNCKPEVMVKAVRTYHLEDEQEPKLSVRLERGWKVFFDANRLQFGDTLLFSLVEPMCFKVDLLDRGK